MYSNTLANAPVYIENKQTFQCKFCSDHDYVDIDEVIMPRSNRRKSDLILSYASTYFAPTSGQTPDYRGKRSASIAFANDLCSGRKHNKETIFSENIQNDRTFYGEYVVVCFSLIISIACILYFIWINWYCFPFLSINYQCKHKVLSYQHQSAKKL